MLHILLFMASTKRTTPPPAHIGYFFQNLLFSVRTGLYSPSDNTNHSTKQLGTGKSAMGRSIQLYLLLLKAILHFSKKNHLSLTTPTNLSTQPHPAIPTHYRAPHIPSPYIYSSIAPLLATTSNNKQQQATTLATTSNKRVQVSKHKQQHTTTSPSST